MRTFSQSVDLLDRYLAGNPRYFRLCCNKGLDVSIAKNQLQLAGITSVYLASKVVECLPLNVDTCVMYTDYSVTKVCLDFLKTSSIFAQDQLIEMEFIMISHFKWEVYTTLACDMVAPLLYKLNLCPALFTSSITKIKSFLDLCLTGNHVILALAI